MKRRVSRIALLISRNLVTITAHATTEKNTSTMTMALPDSQLDTQKEPIMLFDINSMCASEKDCAAPRPTQAVSWYRIRLRRVKRINKPAT